MSKNLLVVDDEAPTRELLALYFKRRGYEVTTTSTGQDCLRLIQEASFDLVILDINLEDANGLDLLVPLKAARPALPVIMFTGLEVDEALLKKAKDNGAQGLISKTQPLREMLQVIQQTIG